MSGVEFHPPANHLYRNTPLDFAVEFAVLGIRVLFESNSRAVIQAAEESFGVWREVARRAELCSTLSARVRLFVQDGEEGPKRHAPLRYRWPDPDRMLVATPGSFGVAEVNRREAYAFVTIALVADTRHFQFGILEALTLVLVTGADRHAIHAATVSRGEAAVLLCGASASGKSTLAYAASRAGLQVLGEEVAYVQLQPAFRIWAMPGRLHLPFDAATHFPELCKKPATVQANGKHKITVASRSDGSSVLPVAERAGVCLLSPGADSASLERVSPAVIEEALTTELDEGFDRFPETAVAAVGRLARNGGWRLHVSSDPRESVALIHQMVSEVAAES